MVALGSIGRNQCYPDQGGQQGGGQRDADGSNGTPGRPEIDEVEDQQQDTRQDLERQAFASEVSDPMEIRIVRRIKGREDQDQGNDPSLQERGEDEGGLGHFATRKK